MWLYRLTWIVVWVVSFPCYGQVSDIDSILSSASAEIGVAYGVDNGTVHSWNNERDYPMMSVFKVPVAVTALHKMQLCGTSPDSMITVTTQQLSANTWSPLRDRYPQGNVAVSLKELIYYTISLSDNNTCDILIDYCGGIGVVRDMALILSDGKCRISATEQDMHDDIDMCYHNICTPEAMVKMLRNIYSGDIITGEMLDIFSDSMLATNTGLDKMRAGIDGKIRLGHKTGSSDRTISGIKIGDNDAGVVYLPDGRCCYIVVFVKDSSMTDKENAAAISDIAGCIINSLMK